MKTHHKPKIGIIGGVGPQASAYLYQELIKNARVRHGAEENHQYPEVILYSLPIPDFISDTSRLPLAKKMLHQATADLEAVWRDNVSAGK